MSVELNLTSTRPCVELKPFLVFVYFISIVCLTIALVVIGRYL